MAPNPPLPLPDWAPPWWWGAALVAGWVGCPVQFSALRAFDTADIMAGCKAIRAQITRDLEQIGEFHAHITFDARDWRPSGHIFVSKVGDHGIAKAAFIIKDIMRDADPVGHGARIPYVLPGAAAAGAADCRAMIIKLKRDTNGFRARAGSKSGNDAGVDAARHGNDDSPLRKRFGQLELGLHGRAYNRLKRGIPARFPF